MELAAKMYEFEKYKGIQFRIAKSNFKSEYEIQVLNHFYVKNVSINRSENPTLKNYKMVQKSLNQIEYVAKSSEEIEDHLDITVLESLDNIKK